MEEFNALEQLQEASNSLGWNVQYQQRSKGDFKYRAMLKESNAGISLMREALNLNIEVAGEYPSKLIVVAAPVKGGVLWGNGCIIVTTHPHKKVKKHLTAFLMKKIFFLTPL